MLFFASFPWQALLNSFIRIHSIFTLLLGFTFIYLSIGDVDSFSLRNLCKVVVFFIKPIIVADIAP
jgi:hypothetical protein